MISQLDLFCVLLLPGSGWLLMHCCTTWHTVSGEVPAVPLLCFGHVPPPALLVPPQYALLLLPSPMSLHRTPGAGGDGERGDAGPGSGAAQAPGWALRLQKIWATIGRVAGFDAMHHGGPQDPGTPWGQQRSTDLAAESQALPAGRGCMSL
jgi:hypothetical protein